MNLTISLLDAVTNRANQIIAEQWLQFDHVAPRPELTPGIVRAVLQAYYDKRFVALEPERQSVSPEGVEARP